MKKLIILRGPSGVGKSTVAKILAKKLGKTIEKLAIIPIDLGIEKLIINRPKIFERKFSEIMQKNLVCLVNNFLSMEYTVIVEGLFYKTYNKLYSLQELISIGKKQKAKVIVIELQSNFKTIEERIKLREKENPKHDNKIEHARKRYNLFMRKLHLNAIKIDTEEKSPEKIVGEIISKIKPN